MRRILQEEGMNALFRGWQPRVLFHIPSAAICWGIYESFKSWLSVINRDEDVNRIRDI